VLISEVCLKKLFLLGNNSVLFDPVLFPNSLLDLEWGSKSILVNDRQEEFAEAVESKYKGIL